MRQVALLFRLFDDVSRFGHFVSLERNWPGPSLSVQRVAMCLTWTDKYHSLCACQRHVFAPLVTVVDVTLG